MYTYIYTHKCKYQRLVSFLESQEELEQHFAQVQSQPEPWDNQELIADLHVDRQRGRKHPGKLTAET